MKVVLNAQVVDGLNAEELMHEITVNYTKLHPAAKAPYKKNFEDACWDLFAIEDCTIYPGQVVKVRTGIAIELPKTYQAYFHDRSGMASKGIHMLGGVIDGPYRGELVVVLTNLNLYDVFQFPELPPVPYEIKAGDRVIQMELKESNPHISFNLVDSVSSSVRGEAGFGSSGR